jgi:hypothetical protein
MDFKIAVTPEEKKQVIMYYDNIRKEMAKFRDEIDSITEEKYHAAVMKRTKMYKEWENAQKESVNVSPPEQQEIVSSPPSPTNVSDNSQESGYFEFVKNKVKRSYWGCGF